MVMKKFIKIHLNKLAADKAYFSAPDGQEIILPRDLLSQEIKEGQSLYLKVSEDLDDRQLSQQEAKALLEEIINSGETEITQ